MFRSVVTAAGSGRWRGAIDELRVSDTADYGADFAPPASFSRMHNGSAAHADASRRARRKFSRAESPGVRIDLGSRRHLFLDDALIAKRENITFTAHPARVTERVMQGSGWISVVDAGPEDIRLYANGPENTLAVFLSKDGVNFTAPDLGRGEFRGRKNIVVTDPASVGTVFIDRNGPPDERWKIVTGLRQRGGIFVYTSADGFNWRRHEAASLPFWAGSAVNVFYDDQRQRYVIHNRTDYYRTRGGSTDRKSLLTEVSDLLAPWPFQPVTRGDDSRGNGARHAAPMRTSSIPGGSTTVRSRRVVSGWSIRSRLKPIRDRSHRHRYLQHPRAEVSLGRGRLCRVSARVFPLPSRRSAAAADLAEQSEGRGSGLVETQLAVSRDGLSGRAIRARPISASAWRMVIRSGAPMSDTGSCGGARTLAVFRHAVDLPRFLRAKDTGTRRHSPARPARGWICVRSTRPYTEAGLRRSRCALPATGSC